MKTETVADYEVEDFIKGKLIISVDPIIGCAGVVDITYIQ